MLCNLRIALLMPLLAVALAWPAWAGVIRQAPSVLPEPEALALFALGLLGFTALRRRVGA